MYDLMLLRPRRILDQWNNFGPVGLFNLFINKAIIDNIRSWTNYDILHSNRNGRGVHKPITSVAFNAL